jgi:hypothetical protein
VADVRIDPRLGYLAGVCRRVRRPSGPVTQEADRVVREAEYIQDAEFDVLSKLREVLVRVERIERALAEGG